MNFPFWLLNLNICLLSPCIGCSVFYFGLANLHQRIAFLLCITSRHIELSSLTIFCNGQIFVCSCAVHIGPKMVKIDNAIFIYTQRDSLCPLFCYVWQIRKNNTIKKALIVLILKDSVTDYDNDTRSCIILFWDISWSKKTEFKKRSNLEYTHHIFIKKS